MSDDNPTFIWCHSDVCYTVTVSGFFVISITGLFCCCWLFKKKINSLDPIKSKVECHKDFEHGNGYNSMALPGTWASLDQILDAESNIKNSVRIGNSPSTSNSVRKTKLYIYSNTPNEVRKNIIWKKFRDEFDLQDINKQEDITGQVVLVHGIKLGRMDLAIHACLKNAPGEPHLKVLVVFEDNPLICPIIDGNSGNLQNEAVCHISCLNYSSTNKELWSTVKNESILADLKDTLHQLVRSRQTVRL